MTDLSAALKEAGHDELAAALERKSLAGQLRQAGRDDLADALEADQPPAEQTPAAPTDPVEAARQQEAAALYEGLVRAGIAPAREGR